MLGRRWKFSDTRSEIGRNGVATEGRSAVIADTQSMAQQGPMALLR